MAFAQAARFDRPIPGAVATVGVSDRVAFLRKTYAHLGVALVVFTLLTAAMMRFTPSFGLAFATGGGSMGGAILALVLFLVVAWGAQRLAQSETSRALQYLGLGLGVVLWSVLAQPMLWYTILKFGNPADFVTANGFELHAALSAKAALVIGEAVVITLAIFIGLTATVFVTRKDFSFLRGTLSIASFAIIGLGLAAMLFGSFNMSLVYSALVIGLMAGYILYETSVIMNAFRPTQHVSAALMLFGTIVTLFIHILRIMSELNRR
ncbi:MAG: Bax inhibitor-1 family protein [Acidobacteriota bacterium]